ncbi:MAG: T9SS type A sorting domain-containing protein [Bacteroidetes bacterium]|nr:T9SS type A sorting domain-containing protein [Bacteroidota bacterium]
MNNSLLIVKILLTCFLLLASLVTMRAQSLDRQVFASAGNTALTTSGLQIDYTIGEPVIAPLSNAGLLLTQGFQQPFSYVLSGNSVFPFLAIYPNPTQGNTILHFRLPAEGTLKVVVHNAIGQRMLTAAVHYASGESQYLLQTASLLPGTYFVTVSLDGFGVVSKKLLKLDR